MTLEEYKNENGEFDVRRVGRKHWFEVHVEGINKFPLFVHSYIQHANSFEVRLFDVINSPVTDQLWELRESVVNGRLVSLVLYYPDGSVRQKFEAHCPLLSGPIPVHLNYQDDSEPILLSVHFGGTLNRVKQV